jgi:RimJ/RimL family protein N-acetyltransferase
VLFPENIASYNLLKKFRFREEGLLREYIIQNNVPKNTIVLPLLKKDIQLN